MSTPQHEPGGSPTPPDMGGHVPPYAGPESAGQSGPQPGGYPGPSAAAPESGSPEGSPAHSGAYPPAHSPAHSGAYPAAYPAASTPRDGGTNGLAIASIVLAGIILLWDIIEASLLYSLVASGGTSAYQVVAGIAAWGMLAVSIGAIVTGALGVRRDRGRALAGAGLGIGAYVFLSGVIWLVIGLFGRSF